MARCKSAKVTKCAVKIGRRRFKAKSCMTDAAVKVCKSHKRGRKQTYKAIKTDGAVVQLYRK